MPGLVIGGRQFAIPGLSIRNFVDDEKLALSAEDGRDRTTKWVRSIFNHTTLGIPSVPGKDGYENQPQKYLPEKGPKLAEGTLEAWTLSKTSGGAHLIGGQDGEILCTKDLLFGEAYHATSVNGVSIGVEWVQGKDASLYEEQMDQLVPLMDGITWLLAHLFGSPIQRQIHQPFRAYHPVARLASGGKDCSGLFGHRDQTDNRGPGDPGDWVAERLLAAGYESFNFDKGADLSTWKQRQADLGMADADCDGIPGAKTAAALLDKRGSALWVSRPLDAQMAALYPELPSVVAALAEARRPMMASKPKKR